ncbi:MAG: polyribonucleotide nucleotidyltransferase [Deltaproteobacteria bacterium]|nr:polyribonucleotide nucleotidyltransferase [Deltaproteobacteria bacterium]
MTIIRETVKIGDKLITLETGKIAKQAGGAVIVTCGESVVMVTVCGSKDARPGQSFLPLTVDYVEKTYAAGKIPGGFFKREGRLREHEVLTSRLIDRPCRPLFPDGYRSEIQVIATVLSHDGENETDVLAMVGASAALGISPIPFAGPIAGVRVGRVDGTLIANPTNSELESSDFDLLIAASKDAVVMVEGEADEVPEKELIEAIMFGHESVQGALELQVQMQEAVGKEKWVFEPTVRDSAIDARVKEVALKGIEEACTVATKFERYGAFKQVKKDTIAALAAEFEGQEGDIGDAYETLRYNTMRGLTLSTKKRVDGRAYDVVRPIAIEAGLLPRVHGSSLFTRGETQAIVTTTLGTAMDEQKIDGLKDPYWKAFLLHYNFPPYSVGETKFLRGPGRREIGHGNLAERALKKLVPSKEDFPYTIRIVSEITESNGSSSMATVCGGSLAMMDAGVPLKAPVAGVAMGLIKEGDDYAILTDILGDEDHLGDMDFKVCGTEKGITAIQMDIKIDGLSAELMTEALDQARAGRVHILNEMNKVLGEARDDLSKYAPRITTIKVKPDQIRLVIGPGGKMIKAIVEQTGAQINVSDDGTVSIAGSDPEGVQKAIAIIEGLTTEPEVGTKYKGTVRRIERYGAFLEIAPGKDGLLHITDMDWGFVDNVEDLMKLGDEVDVVVSNIDREGRIKLSRKPLIEKPEGYEEKEDDRGDRGGRGGRGGGGGRDRDRGGRGRRDDRGGRGGRDRDRGGRGGRGGERGERSARDGEGGGDGEGRRRRRRRRRPEGEGEGGGEARTERSEPTPEA